MKKIKRSDWVKKAQDPSACATKRSSKLLQILASALIACAIGAVCAPALAIEPVAAPASTAVTALRLQEREHIAVDGSLDHPAWQRAAVYDNFVEKDPKNGASPKQRTTVRVLIDAHALYFGIEAFDTEPEKIRAPMVRHDGVNRTQDFVVVYVDAVGARKAAQFFRVSASGSTADGLHTAENDNEDFAPDFDFDAAAKINAQGYTAVVRIPFASLRYAKQTEGGWKMMVARRLPREQTYLFASVQIPTDSPSFIATLQPLQGVSPPEHQQFLTLRPTLTLRRTEQDGEVKNENILGADIKWRPTAEWVIDGTINPDFSQVELDVPQLSRNSRFAQSLIEKRPFFLESSDLWVSPTSALYTRSFTQPRWGARASWRGEGASGTALLLHDDGGGTILLPHAYYTAYADQPSYNGAATRLRRDDSSYTLGMIASNRSYDAGKGRNSVVGIDGTWQLMPTLKMRSQLLMSDTTAQPDPSGQLQQGDTTRGSLFDLVFNHRSDAWEAELVTKQKSAGYRNDSGFTYQSGVRDISGNINRIWRGDATPGGRFNEFWVYLWAARTDALEQPKMVSGYVTPGVFINAANNTEITLEYRGWDWVRLSPTSPLHRQDHAHIEFATQPASWWTKFAFTADPGRLVDYVQDRLRPGAKFTLSSQLRAHRLLEIEPQISQVALRGDAGESAIAYRESATQLLAVLHLSATQKLRYIGQQTHFSATGIASDTRTTHSLTYSWRRHAGTVAYLGFSNNRDAQPGVYATRGKELFVKLQMDVDDFLRP